MDRLGRRGLLAALALALGQLACAPPAATPAPTPRPGKTSGAGQTTPDRASATPTADVPPTAIPAPTSPPATPTGVATTATAGAGPSPPAKEVERLDRVAKVLPGIDVLLAERLDLVAGRRVGLVTNPTGVTAGGTSGVDALHGRPELRLVALFGPEHGIRGDAEGGAAVASTTDWRTGLPVYSLYGETRRPTAEMLRDLDVLLFDVQDVGVRFYTYVSTLAYVMQAAAAHGKRVVVLDRPNPIGGLAVEGPVLEHGQESFVGLYPIALRHGMTVGELACLFNEEFGIHCDLAVVPAAGWRRSLWFDRTGLRWVPPSPNIRTLDSATVYPCTGMLEGTNVSEGRGTPRPFENVGAPWIDGERWARALSGLGLPGVEFQPTWFMPDSSKYRGERCGGVFLVVADRERFRPVETGLSIVATALRLYPEHFAWQAGGGFDLLVGNAWLRRRLAAGAEVGELAQAWQARLDEFRSLRQRYLLYPV